jgi:hypothetical protein
MPESGWAIQPMNRPFEAAGRLKTTRDVLERLRTFRLLAADLSSARTGPPDLGRSSGGKRLG